MALDDRRPSRTKRGSTRNESCGIGGNDPAEKPRLRKREDTTPVRKPRLSVDTPKPKEKRVPNAPKIRDAKPDGMSLNASLDALEEFNDVVNALTNTGIEIVRKAGGFSVVECAQKNLLGELRSADKSDMPVHLLETFSRLEDTVRTQRFTHKERRADGSWRYYYE